MLRLRLNPGDETAMLACVGADLHAHALADCRTLVQEQRSLAHHRTAHASADLRGVPYGVPRACGERVCDASQLGSQPCTGCPVGVPALQECSASELPDCVGIRNAGGVHLRDQGVQFALKGITSLALSAITDSYCTTQGDGSSSAHHGLKSIAPSTSTLADIQVRGRIHHARRQINRELIPRW